jgi:hypothetical protein
MAPFLLLYEGKDLPAVLPHPQILERNATLRREIQRRVGMRQKRGSKGA